MKIGNFKTEVGNLCVESVSFMKRGNFKRSMCSMCAGSQFISEQFHKNVKF